MKTTASFLRIICFLVLSIIVLEFGFNTGKEWAMFTQPILFWGIIATILLFAIALEICIEALKDILFKSLNTEQQKEYTSSTNQNNWYQKLSGTKPLEEEHEIILDHNYDGIKELDNNLPPWWVYFFYATIIFAVVYFFRFQIIKDYTQAEEYQMAVTKENIRLTEWKKTAKNLVDAETVTLLTEASDLKSGEKVFNENCVACHKADGGGGIGPNLTDKYWILGGGIKNVFTTVSEGGRSGKGMIPWKNELKPIEIAQVSSYVLSFQGTTPAEPKVAEGDVWNEDTSEK